MVLERVAQGDLSARVRALSSDDPAVVQLGELINRALSRAGESVSREGIDKASELLVKVADEGDLTSWNVTSDDAQLRGLYEGVGRVLETQRTFVREINEAALRLSSSANEVLAASTQHETSSTEQAAAIHETTATMEELKHASAQIAENAGSVARVAEETLGAARSGRTAIHEFTTAMQQIRSDGLAVVDSISKLSKRVERIGTVVEVIDEIADRSDLLALNAALEGSRAGEAGKGFSIVAAEMRRLAENVLESTKEIKNLISEIRESTHAAAAAAEASRRATEQGEKLGSVAAQSVDGILSGVQETSDAARVINLATQQQRTATEQVVASMSEIEDVTRQTTQASRQATSAAADLAQLANRLAELIKRFRAD
ncbi:MAG: methyl-accepting chemotaxis protein [Deltaproteobacteria bacterium]|nr:methyl-accepting chemotaxis protein [Deltaproteobacteria bacterium]